MPRSDLFCPLRRIAARCAILLCAAVCLQAAAPIEQVVARKGARARVLVLDDGAARAAAPAVQQALDDDANLWVAAPTDADARPASLKAYLGPRPWDVLYIDPAFRGLYKTFPGATDLEKQAALLEKARTQCRILLVPADTHAEEPADAGRSAATPAMLSNAFKNALYARVPLSAQPPKNRPDPAKMLADPAALNNPAALPALNAQHIEVYRAQAGKEQFNMHPFIAYYDGLYWILWSSGPVDEDGPHQFLRYAVSKDGLAWSEPKTLAAAPRGAEAARPWRWMPGGLYVKDGKLMALGALFFGSDNKANPKKIWLDLKTYRFEWTGNGWENKGLFLDDGLVYFPPWGVGDDQDLIVWRDTHGHFYTARAGNDGVYGPRRALPVPLPDYRMSETSAIVGENGVVHLFIRDQGYTNRIYRSVSFDSGATWTTPVKTDYPDAASKNMSGKLSNGWYYFINNPGKTRDPLSIAFSRDGWMFSHPTNLCVNAPARRYPGKFKNELSFQYAHAIEHDGALWVVCSVNKEDILLTRVSLQDFPVQ